MDIDEAKRRLEFQSIVMELTAQLMTRERDVVGDMRIEHLPDFHVVISVVPGGKEQVRPYIEGGSLSDITTFEIVEYTKDQLRADLERTDELLAPYDILYGAAVTEREVQIFVLEDVEALQQRLDKDGVVLPPTVQLVQALGPDVDDATVIRG